MTLRPWPKKGMPPKKEKKPLKRTPIKKKFKKTGEGETHQIVLDNLGETQATCFVCGLPLAYVDHNNFAHILPKKQYELFRNEPENIKIMCMSKIARICEKTGKSTNGCHYLWDFTPRSELKHEMWAKVFELEQELKEAYKDYEENQDA